MGNLGHFIHVVSVLSAGKLLKVIFAQFGLLYVYGGCHFRWSRWCILYTNRVRWANYILQLLISVNFLMCAQNYECWLAVEGSCWHLLQ